MSRLRSRTILAVMTGLVLTVMTGLAAAPPASARPGDGSLTMRIGGLPRKEHALVVVDGPTGNMHVHRVVRKVGITRLRNLPAGTYRVHVKRVRLRHRTGNIRRGAVATAVRRNENVRVAPHRNRKIGVRYGTIVNPGIRSVSGHISEVLGDPLNPEALVLFRTAGIRKGQALSARPSDKLPHGLLAYVTGISRHGRKISVTVRPAGIYEVVPNMSFRTSLSASGGATSQAALCQLSGPGLHPYIHISNIYATGGWTTTKVAFWDVKTGATIDIHLHAAAGLKVNAGARLSCSLPLPSLTVQGMAGPIPVYGSIAPGADAEVAAGATMSADGSTNITMGTHVDGAPPSAQPHLAFDSPKFNFQAGTFAGANASLSLNAEVGVGAAGAANLHLRLGNALQFSASPGRCSWDLNLGTFSVGGQLGPFSVTGPSTPPLYHRNLWHRACGGSQASPPPVQLPLVRATMGWDTDSDIDLYTWDQEGRLIAYFERYGIPNAELVEDVIPGFGEWNHAPEIFQETAEPFRTYTFGICDYHGEGADVTLNVTDPDGGHRTFEQTLYGPGDYAVVTTSPTGQGYDPGYGWCSYSEE